MKRVLIIGGGVVGLSTAYYCRCAGHDVTVLDRGTVDHENCSYGNAGLVVPSHFVPLAAPGMVAMGLKWMRKPDSPFYVKPRLSSDLFGWGLRFCRAANMQQVRRAAPLLRDLNVASRGCFEELAKLAGNPFDYQQRGLLCLCQTEHRLEEEAKVVEHARQLGLKAEIFNAKQAAEFDPHIRMEIVGAVYFRDDGHVTPARFMATLKEQLDRLGVAVSWSTEVVGFTHHASRITAVRTSRGEFAADEFVLCAGSWSASIARNLGLRLPLQAGKGYSLTLPKPRHSPVVPAILTEARVAVTPMSGSLRFGGTMEIAGLNEDINPIRVQGIIKSVSKYYPDFTPRDFEGIKPWCGLRPCSPDGLPYLGRTARYANLAVATGHAMMGLSLGPISGKLIAEILSGQNLPIDIRLLNPDRYA
ncbi:MAG: FAD-dependent oxidoreductase [Verrucomicrobiales bacterium]|nr:FAD-dependent oxidoreductase [Verrucomicrobiales bacterium]